MPTIFAKLQIALLSMFPSQQKVGVDHASLRIISVASAADFRARSDRTA